MPRLFLAVLAFCAALGAVSGAKASTTSDVGSPVVKTGSTEFSARAGYSMADDESSEDDRFRTRFHLDHGFTDYYAARILFSQDDRKGDNYEHEGIKFENRFHLLKSAAYGFDFGVRLNYQHKDGDKKPDNLEYGLYELIPFDPWEIRFNQIFSDQIGEEAEDGLEAEWRSQITREVADDLRLGLEAFHDFGNLDELAGFDTQSHTFGPVLKGGLFGSDFKFETGYRAGLSESAPDHSFKFFINRAF